MKHLISSRTVGVLSPSVLDWEYCPYLYLQENEVTQVQTDADLSLCHILDQEEILELHVSCTLSSYAVATVSVKVSAVVGFFG